VRLSHSLLKCCVTGITWHGATSWPDHTPRRQHAGPAHGHRRLWHHIQRPRGWSWTVRSFPRVVSHQRAASQARRTAVVRQKLSLSGPWWLCTESEDVNPSDDVDSFCSQIRSLVTVVLDAPAPLKTRNKCRWEQSLIDWPWHGYCRESESVGSSHRSAYRQLYSIYIHHNHLLLLSSKADTHFTAPRRIEGWVDVRGWLLTEMVYQSLETQSRAWSNFVDQDRCDKRYSSAPSRQPKCGCLLVPTLDTNSQICSRDNWHLIFLASQIQRVFRWHCDPYKFTYLLKACRWTSWSTTPAFIIDLGTGCTTDTRGQYLALSKAWRSCYYCVCGTGCTTDTAFHDRRPSVLRRCARTLRQSAIRSDVFTVSANI